MLISDFAGATGLSRDTVRFYVRLGLLQPKSNGKGGCHPYQIFNREDVQTVEVIRVGQSLGMSLKEIAALDTERREGSMTRERMMEILSAQLARLETKATELATMTHFVRSKLAWLADGEDGPQPDFGQCGCEVQRPILARTKHGSQRDPQEKCCTVRRK
jgi:MerR family copper efflux transcriptional regulator